MQAVRSYLHLLGLLLCLVGIASTNKPDQWMVNEIQTGVRYFREMMSTPAIEALETERLIARYANSNSTSGLSPQCERDMKVLEAAAAMPENNTWIASIQNADGDFPEPGLFLGKRMSVGSYDLCLNVKPTNKPVYKQNMPNPVGTHDFKMRYCAVRWIPQGDWQGYGEGRCVPASCSRQDVWMMMPDLPGIASKYSYCGDVTPISKNVGGIVALTVLSIFVFLVVAASIFDLIYVRWEQEKKEQAKIQSAHKGTGKEASDTQKKPPCPGLAIQALLSFSLQRNVSSLLQTTQRGYGCMNGIRVMCMTWVVLGHAWILDLQTFSANYPANFRLYGRLGHQIIVNGGYSVDTFFFLSGCLVTISVMKAAEQILKRKDRILSTVKFLGLYVFHRYWRLTPVYAALIMLNANLWMYLGEGPLWPEYNGGVYFCKDSWWTNLLYVNNLFKTDTQCMGWSWYLPNDFQFFLILPVFCFALALHPTFGSIFLTLGWAGSLICRIALVMTGKTGFTELYSKPWSRFGTYAIGIATGYIMYRTKCKVKMNRWVVALGWGVATGVMLALVLGTYKRANWSSDVNIAYTVTMRDAFALGVAWIVFACCSGYGGLIDTFLSWKLWIPLSKLCYGCYLLHPIVSFLALANRRELFYIQDITVIYQYFGTLVITMALAFVTAIIFEVPFIKLEKVILPSPKKAPSKPPAQQEQASTSLNQSTFKGNQDQGHNSQTTQHTIHKSEMLNQTQYPSKQEPESINKVSEPSVPLPEYKEKPVDVQEEQAVATVKRTSDPPAYEVDAPVNVHQAQSDATLPPVEVVLASTVIPQQSTSL